MFFIFIMDMSVPLRKQFKYFGEVYKIILCFGYYRFSIRDYIKNSENCKYTKISKYFKMVLLYSVLSYSEISGLYMLGC